MEFFKSLSNDSTVIVYTDGACAGNPGPGGWGVYVIAEGKTHEWNGGNIQTTNNRMELTACIEALKVIPSSLQITLRTDSRYTRDGISSWIKSWKKNGWKTSKNDPVKNVDLWQELDALSQGHKINWEWVAAHSGEHGNERADMLAKQGIVSTRMKS